MNFFKAIMVCAVFSSTVQCTRLFHVKQGGGYGLKGVRHISTFSALDNALQKKDLNSVDCKPACIKLKKYLWKNLRPHVSKPLLEMFIFNKKTQELFITEWDSRIDALMWNREGLEDFSSSLISSHHFNVIENVLNGLDDKELHRALQSKRFCFSTAALIALFRHHEHCFGREKAVKEIKHLIQELYWYNSSLQKSSEMVDILYEFGLPNSPERIDPLHKCTACDKGECYGSTML